jgi:hypothetical protein
MQTFDRDVLLQLIPANAKLIYVKDELGKFRYRLLEALRETDDIQVNTKGIPVTATKSPGRPPKVPVPAPPPAITPTVAVSNQRKVHMMSKDPVLKAIKANPDSPDVLAQVMISLAEESSSISFERQEAERNGTDTSMISGRRVQVLKSLADTWMKRKEQFAAKSMDIESPAFKIVFSHIALTFKAAMVSAGFKSEEVESVFSKVAKAVEDDTWTSDLKNKIKKA